MTTTAADLNRTHLGMIIKVRQGGAEFSDVLGGISHDADLIEERNMMQEVPDFVLGRTITTLKFMRAGDVQIAGSAIVELVGVSEKF